MQAQLPRTLLTAEISPCCPSLFFQIEVEGLVPPPALLQAKTWDL